MKNVNLLNDYRVNKPTLVQIKKIIQESPIVKSLIFDYNPINVPLKVSPGQFFMIWLPGIDEIPMSVSKIGLNNEFQISVANVGDATSKIHQLKEGDKIGIRGPYGTTYKLMEGTSIFIGGGIGMASLLPLIYQNIEQNQNKKDPPKILIIEGTRNGQQLLYIKEISQLLQENCQFEICTDDGSCGFKGYCTDKFKDILNNELKESLNNKSINVYACGPEIMLKKVFQICETFQINLQASLERMMRCGFGICGLCGLDPQGYLVCRDGPIFNSEELRTITDFGRISRDFSGKPFKILK